MDAIEVQKMYLDYFVLTIDQWNTVLIDFQLMTWQTKNIVPDIDSREIPLTPEQISYDMTYSSYYKQKYRIVSENADIQLFNSYFTFNCN